METKNNPFFWSPNKRIKLEEEEEERKEEEEGETKPRYGFSDFCMEIMDSSMILVHELLGYGLLVSHPTFIGCDRR